jgi:hypothetical protein
MAKIEDFYNPEDIIAAMSDGDSGTDAHLQHFKNAFYGYLSVVMDSEELHPFSPGSARDASFQMGVAMAEHHLWVRDDRRRDDDEA